MANHDHDAVIDLTNDDEKKWETHCWSAYRVGQIIASSTDSIRLKPQDDQEKIFVVHRELLCYYSSYYRAALQGSFLGSKKDTLEVQTITPILALLVKWLYTGDFVGSDGDFDFDNSTKLYILADEKMILALRRSLIQRTINSHDLEGRLHSNEDVELAWTDLPESSPLRRWMVESSIHHWKLTSHTEMDTAYHSLPATVHSSDRAEYNRCESQRVMFTLQANCEYNKFER